MLSITGQKIKLQESPKEVKPNYNVKQIHLTPAIRAVEKETQSGNKTIARQAYKLNVKNYTNADVYSKQLKEIYEAIEFDDFKRFLVKNSQTVRKNTKGAQNVIDLKNFYRDYYEVHYNLLKDLIRNHD